MLVVPSPKPHSQRTIAPETSSEVVIDQEDSGVVEPDADVEEPDTDPDPEKDKDSKS